MQESNFSFDLSDSLRNAIIADDPSGIPPRQSYPDMQFQAAIAAAINTFKLQSAILYPSEANVLTGLFGVFNLGNNQVVALDPTFNQSYVAMLKKDPVTFATSLGVSLPPVYVKYNYFVMTYNGLTTDFTVGTEHIAQNTTTIVVFIYTTS